MKKLLYLTFVLLLFGCSTTRNNVKTGKEDYSQIKPLTQKEEWIIGKASVTQLMDKYGLVEDKEKIDYLTLIGSTLAMASDRPETYHGYTFLILNTDISFNMSLPDGYIVVSKGLISNLENEDQLAVMLGFAISKSVFNTAINKLDIQLIKKIREAKDESELKTLFKSAVNQVIAIEQKPYPKEEVKMLDNETLKILDNTGYSPKAYLDVLEITKANYERVKYMKLEINKNDYNEVDSSRTARFKKIF